MVSIPVFLVFSGIKCCVQRRDFHIGCSLFGFQSFIHGLGLICNDGAKVIFRI